MILMNEARLQALATHFVGNNAAGGSLNLSGALVTIEDDHLSLTLKHWLLNAFQQDEVYNFWHPTDLELNEVRHYAAQIFDQPDDLLRHSISLARHLFDITDHPNIKDGEIHVAYFTNLQVDQFVVNALGIYKSEQRETFLRIQEEDKRFVFSTDEGIHPGKPDKACLILDIDGEAGYRVLVLDKTNKGEEAQFWKDRFLKLRPASNDFHATKDYLSMYKDYVVEHIPSEFEVTRVEQIDLLNKSVNFFKKHEQFNKQAFEDEVLQIPEVIESFRRYEEQYATERELSFDEDFSISGTAVKKQSRVFKSVLKLDKNFHVYIHGNKDLIEKGFDATMGMNYYKIYFEEEH